MTPILRDRFRVPPGEPPAARSARALYAAGIRGRAVVARARRA
jgi:hypothetical protein